MGRMSLEDADFRASLGVPKASRAVRATSEEALPLPAEGNGTRVFGMPLEGADFAARLGVPEPGRVATGEYLLALWAEGDGCDIASMPLEGADFLGSLGVPEPSRAVQTTREDAATVAAKGDG
jgi:hypothetical protein